ncbi:hypothetical protein ACVR2O_000563 [Cronobacter turicensis]
MSNAKANMDKKTLPSTVADESEDWLTAEEFTRIEGMPGTARGARMRLEKLAEIHPEIRRKRNVGKGVVYHISAAAMSLENERSRAKDDAFSVTGADKQLSLWVQLFRNMSPASRALLMEQALKQVTKDLASQHQDVSLLAEQIMKLPQEERERLLEQFKDQ